MNSDVSSTTVHDQATTPSCRARISFRPPTNGTHLGATCPFILDGRWLHAFNGPGMTTNAVHANFRYNGQSPNAVGMDEDYDAVDLENWFLAMQSADGSVIIPSFHRPAAIRYDPNGVAGTAINDWPDRHEHRSDWRSASRILRPRQADGHDPNTFPDLVPNATGGITYDVDNDGDGLTDSVWVDLGYPARRNAQGQLYKPLFAFMVIGLNGRIPLNTAGNLAGGRGSNRSTHAAHLGNSVSEVDPTYGLQNGFVSPTTPQGAPSRPRSTADLSYTYAANTPGGQRRHRRPADPAPQPAGRDAAADQPHGRCPVSPLAQPDPTGQTNGDNNFVADQSARTPSTSCPTGSPTQAMWHTARCATAPLRWRCLRLTPPVAGRWGEAQAVPGYPDAFPIPTHRRRSPQPGQDPTYSNPIRAGYSVDIERPARRHAPRRGRRQLELVRPLSAGLGD